MRLPPHTGCNLAYGFMNCRVLLSPDQVQSLLHGISICFGCDEIALGCPPSPLPAVLWSLPPSCPSRQVVARFSVLLVEAWLGVAFPSPPVLWCLPSSRPSCRVVVCRPGLVGLAWLLFAVGSRLPSSARVPRLHPLIYFSCKVVAKCLGGAFLSGTQKLHSQKKKYTYTYFCFSCRS